MFLKSENRVRNANVIATVIKVLFDLEISAVDPALSLCKDFMRPLTARCVVYFLFSKVYPLSRIPCNDALRERVHLSAMKFVIRTCRDIGAQHKYN